MSNDDVLFKEYNLEKLYRVYIEKTYSNTDGYVFKQPQYASKHVENKGFILTFHFKKFKNRNPLCIIDNIDDGDNFEDKINTINNFKRNHALSYSLEVDGLMEVIKEKEEK